MTQDVAVETRPDHPESDAFMRLASYGTFVPGGENHGVLAPLRGLWREGWVEGETRTATAGRWTGYAGFVPLPGGPRLAAWLFESAALPHAWADLDGFEGPAFARRTVAFHLPDGTALPAQIYVLEDAIDPTSEAGA